MDMTTLILIPARLAASRLPGKPLADIGGRSMIVRVCELAAAARIGDVVVAAADGEIADAVQTAGFRAVLTPPDLPSGSDRAFAALEQVDSHCTVETIINLQGDMPTLSPDALGAVLACLEARTGCDIATLAAVITSPQEASDPNTVKAVLGDPMASGFHRAHYFSRGSVPHGAAVLYHHVGVYAYRRAALERFVSAVPSGLERAERLEQLRALELGLQIDCAVLTGPAPNGVDTPADLEAARRFFAQDGNHPTGEKM